MNNGTVTSYYFHYFLLLQNHYYHYYNYYVLLPLLRVNLIYLFIVVSFYRWCSSNTIRQWQWHEWWLATSIQSRSSWSTSRGRWSSTWSAEPQAGRQKAVAAVMELHPPVSCGCKRLGLLRRRCSALRTAQCWLPRRKWAVDKNPLAGILVWYTEISPWSLCILFRHSPFRLLAR